MSACCVCCVAAAERAELDHELGDKCPHPTCDYCKPLSADALAFYRERLAPLSTVLDEIAARDGISR